VLITGGLGDVGLILARHLASAGQCRLVLTARSPLPPRADWARWLDTRTARQDRSSRHVRNSLGLERAGAQVMVASADAADYAAMERIVEQAEQRFGFIDAVVHGAGVSAAQYFATAHELDRAACETHFRAKVHGFKVLDDILRDRPCSTRMTLSSLSAVLGGIRLGPYAAANAAMDAYALTTRTDGTSCWQTVDWDTWRTDTATSNELGSGVQNMDMSPAEGVSVFERALPVAETVAQLVISTHSIDDRLISWLSGTPDGDVGPAGTGDNRHPRPSLTTPHLAPKNAAERGLCDVWSLVLGLDEVGVEDNFYELGGNSLIAMQLMGQIRRQLRAAGPVTALLEHPTIRELASVLRFPASDDSGLVTATERKLDE